MMSSATRPSDASERLRERLQWFLFSRVLLASAFLGTLAVVYLRSGGQRYTVSVGLLLGAIVLTYGFTIASAVLLLRLERLVVFTYVQLGFDVLLTSGVVLVSGGGDSPFGFFYGLGVINAAALLSTPCALATALGSCAAYTSLIALLAGGAIAQPDYPFHPSPPDLQLVLRVGTTDATFFVIALLAGSLVRRLHQAEWRLGQAEIAHHHLAALHEALARNIGCALITTDNQGAVTSLNQTAEEITGQCAADAIGKDVGVLFAALRHSPTGRRQFLQSATNVQPTEFVHRLADEREVSLRCSTVALSDTYHNFIGTLYIIQDVSKLREMERHFDDEAVAGTPVPGLEIEEPPETNGLLGTSPAIMRVHGVIGKVAKSDATLLITGESGTGKELVARTVHAQSARRDRPFIAVNCGAIPADLMESELFGHARGAFTGAVAARTGLFRTADGGTMFLDEVGDLPLPLQVKLLRVLQERSFTPVGSDTHVTIDVRIIAATNRPLLQEVQAGRFRDDLFYRLNVVTLELPPLRDRRQDIPLLVRRFLRQFSEVHSKHVQRLSVAAARLLQVYPYPGNVRELENIIEHGIALCDGETIHEEHLPAYALQAVTGERPAPPPPQAIVPPPVNHIALELAGGNLDDSVAAYEKRILLRALAEAGGVKTRAAGILGINYRSLRHRLEKYSLGTPLTDLESESDS